MGPIPAGMEDLVSTDHYATLATVGPDGTPHQTVVWIDYDGTHLLVNTGDGRQKVKNVRADPKVSVNVIDADDPHRYITVSGEVVELTTEGAGEHANELGWRYGEFSDDESFMEDYSGPERLIVRIEPDDYFTHTPE